MILLPNFLSAECIEQTRQIANASTSWVPNLYVSSRLHAKLSSFPLLQEELKKLGEFTLLTEDTIYFARYNENERCLNHIDPSVFTIVVELESAERGGQLLVEADHAVLSVGDAVLFRGERHHMVMPVKKGSRLSLAIWFKQLDDKLVSGL